MTALDARRCIGFIVVNCIESVQSITFLRRFAAKKMRKNA